MATTSINLNPYKPVWLLNQDLISNTPAISDAAAVELLTRITENKLKHHEFDFYLDVLDDQTNDQTNISPLKPLLKLPTNNILLLYAGADENIYTMPQTIRLLALITKIQNSKKYNWDTNLGNIFMHFKQQGFTDQDQWIQFLEKAFTDRIIIPDSAVQGTPEMHYQIYSSYTPYFLLPKGSAKLIAFTPKTKVIHPKIEYVYSVTNLTINAIYRGYDYHNPNTPAARLQAFGLHTSKVELEDNVVKLGTNLFESTKDVSIIDPASRRYKLIHSFTCKTKQPFILLPKGTIQLTASTSPKTEKIINESLMMSDVRIVKETVVPGSNIRELNSLTLLYDQQSAQLLEYQEMLFGVPKRLNLSRATSTESLKTRNKYSALFSARRGTLLKISKLRNSKSKSAFLQNVGRFAPYTPRVIQEKPYYVMDLSHYKLPINFIYDIQFKVGSEIIHTFDIHETERGYIEKDTSKTLKIIISDTLIKKLEETPNKTFDVHLIPNHQHLLNLKMTVWNKPVIFKNIKLVKKIDGQHIHFKHANDNKQDKILIQSEKLFQKTVTATATVANNIASPRTIITLDIKQALKFPISADAYVQYPGKKALKVGSVVTRNNKTRTGGSNSQCTFLPATPAQKYQKFDLILKPNPVHLQTQLTGTVKTFNKTIIFKNIQPFDPNKKPDLQYLKIFGKILPNKAVK